MLPALSQRIVLSLTTIPTTATVWNKVVGISVATTSTAGFAAIATGFINFPEDWDPSPSCNNPLQPISAFFFPSLLEELFWRGALIPSPSVTPINAILPVAGFVVTAHVLSHPIAAATIWPRGERIFGDPRFLLLATIVLGGATASYIVSGGSVWAAALTHGLPVALWRDFCGGEKRLSKITSTSKQQ